MDAMLVSFIDHGATPPSTLAARNTATTGASIRGAVAAGVLGFGRYHGGDALACRQLLDEGLALARDGPVDGRGRDDAGRSAGRRPAKSRRRASATGTTRSIRARRACCRSRTSWKLDHEHTQLIRAIEHALTRHPALEGSAAAGQHRRRDRGRRAATSACRRKSPTRLLIISRVPGLAAHALEEQRREHADARDRPDVARLRRAVGATAAGADGNEATGAMGMSSMTSDSSMPELRSSRRLVGASGLEPVTPAV